MKKILIFSFVLILLIGSVQASIIATIGMKGLSMTNPEAAEAINTIICVSNPVVCAQGKIIGQVYGEAMQELAKTSPEAAEAVATYNQVKELSDMGAEIKKELQINDKGEIEKGTIQFSNDKEVNIGHIIGLEEEDISIRGMEVRKEKDKNTLIFTDKDAKTCIKGNCFENIKSQSESEHPTYLELDEQGNIIKADFTTNEKGGSYILGGSSFDVPPNSRVYYNKENGLQFPEYTEVREIKYSGKITGENIKLPEGSIMNSGSLSYENGQVYLALEEEVEINHVEIGNPTSENVYVFFDGKEHENSFVSFGNKNLVARSTFGEDMFEIDFKENNPYLQIDEGDYFNTLIMPDSEMEIQNRDSLGLIPKVTTNGDFIINEDSKSFFSSGEKIIIDPNQIIDIERGNFRYLKTDFTTSPIELVMLDKDSSPLLTEFNDIKGHSIMIDNFNRIAVIPEGLEEFVISYEQEFSGLYEGKIAEFSPRLSYNYIGSEDIKILTGKNLEFYGVSEGQKDMVLGKFRDWYETLTPETKESFDTIIIDDSLFTGSNNDAGAFSLVNGEVVFKSNSFNYEYFRHELVHMLDFELKRNDIDELRKDLLSEIESKRIEIFKQKREIEDAIEISSSPEEIQKLNQILDNLKEEGKELSTEHLNIKSSFDREWEASGVTEMEPPYYGGYVRQDWWENKAVPLGKINEPEFFSCYISPSCEDYKPENRKKIDLYYKYGFISNEEYNDILSAAGVK